MKGVVLAGGLGREFKAVTKVVNKHLLDVYDEPMVFFPIRKLAEAGVEDVILITGQEDEQFKALLGDGATLGVNLSYGQQVGEGGIADALRVARGHVGDSSMVVILGDNLYQDNLTAYIDSYLAGTEGGRVLLKRVSLEDARRFGVARFIDDKIVAIEEKPENPPSDLVITGCYMYDARVFDIIDTLVPSDRGALELTDVNNAYLQSGGLGYDILKGWWTTAGNPASKLKASILVALAKGVTFHA